MNIDLKWHLIALKVTKVLSSELFSHVLNLLMKMEHYQYVILKDIDGAPKRGRGPAIFYLQQLEDEIMPIKKIIKTLSNIQHLEWGDFFLFENSPPNWPGVKIGSYPPLIKETNTTIRAIDQTYLYIYTPSLDVIKIIQKDNSPDYIIESIETDALENLSYPY
ncbi:MAG: hypothetical protein ACSNEK_10335 [Parachlamydiaceae bacterium]